MTEKIKLKKDYTGIVEQLIRPTGLLDPLIDVKPIMSKNLDNLRKQLSDANFTEMSIFRSDYTTVNQIDDLLGEVQKTIEKGFRVLVTTLTKRMAEELTNYIKEIGISVQYIHSDIETIERVEILRDLRLGKYDVLVGINLLREGLDLPEVALVCILDADKEGFLRSNQSLIQTIGRAARHQDGRVIMYADNLTKSMHAAITETYRRRKIQEDYNKKHGIIPKTIKKEIKEHVIRVKEKVDQDRDKVVGSLEKQAESYKIMSAKEKKAFKTELELQMRIYADMLEFEKAAKLRDIMDTL